MRTFRRIGKDAQDLAVSNFLEAVGGLEALDRDDLDELADALLAIGRRIRSGSPGRGLIMLAKIIVDHAATEV